MVITSRKMLFKNSPVEMLHRKNLIYLMRLRKDGRLYVGKTTRELRVRILEHISCGKNYHLENAIRKYGIEAFDIYVILECEDEAALNYWESFFIALLDCKHPNGFNRTDGGEGFKGLEFTEKHRNGIAAKARLRTHSQKTRDQISESKKGQGKGVPLKPETVAKMRASSPHKKAVFCIELNKTFESINAAVRDTGISRQSISNVCLGKAITGGGYHWSFIDADGNLTTIPKKPSESDGNLTANQKKASKSRMRAVQCKETGKIFPSIAAAAEWLEVRRSRVGAVINRSNRKVKGYHFVYVDKSIGDKTPENHRKRKVICLDNGKIFESIADAAEWAKINQRGIGMVCRGKMLTAGGYHWAYYKEGEAPEIREDSANCKVICKETGKIFPTIVEAAEWAGVNPSGIGAACRGQQHTAAGKHWAYVDDNKKHTKAAKRKVICKDNGKIFESLVKAAEWAGVHQNGICAACNGRAITAGGKHWAYADDDEK